MVVINFKFVPRGVFIISLSFCTAPVSSIVAEGLVAEVRVYTITGEPVELKLSD